MAHSKKPKHIVNVGKSKKPSEEKGKRSYYDLTVSFSFRKYDAETPWSISKDGKPSVDKVFKSLYGFECAVWSEIIQASGGRSHGTNNHHIPVRELDKDVIKHADDIGLNESELFSLRIDSNTRLWGVIEPENGCFYVIWFDPGHKVYPIRK